MTMLTALLKARSVDAAAHDAATSDLNLLRKPTEAQASAGNYKMGHTRIAGLAITIENPAGSRRRPEWPPMKAHYGYVKGTEGADGDHVDVFVQPGTPEDWDGSIYVIDQADGQGGFDEHKCMVGYDSEREAVFAYLAHFPSGWELGAVTALSLDEFKAWLRDGDTTVPLVDLDNEPACDDHGRAGSGMAERDIPVAGMKKEWTQSASPTSGITAYGGAQRKKRRRVKLRPGVSLLRLVKYSPDQPRDERGRWAGGAGGSLEVEPVDVLGQQLHDEAQAVIAANAMAEDKPAGLTDDQKATARAELADSLNAAAAAKPAFDETVTGIADAVGGRASLAPIKGGERLLEKHVLENGSDPAQMRDLVRGSIVVSSPAEVPAVLAAIQQKYTVTRLKDRFAEPLPTGYSDMLINVRLPGGIDGEIQVHIPEMIAAKKVGHAVYNIDRALPAGDARRSALVDLQNRIYGSAIRANQRRRTGGSKPPG